MVYFHVLKNKKKIVLAQNGRNLMKKQGFPGLCVTSYIWPLNTLVTKKLP